MKDPDRVLRLRRERMVARIVDAAAAVLVGVPVGMKPFLEGSSRPVLRRLGVERGRWGLVIRLVLEIVLLEGRDRSDVCARHRHGRCAT